MILYTNLKHNMLSVIRKCVKNNTKSSTEMTKIHLNILNVINNQDINIINKLEIIDNILVPFKRQLSIDRQDFICNQIATYIREYPYVLKINPNTNILDIGGGNGNVLSFLGHKYDISASQLVCLEEQDNITDKSFTYDFSHKNISYKFWDNISDIESQKFDIIICMVSIHHMTDKFIKDKLIPSIKQWASPNAVLLIKEHDIQDSLTFNITLWEHHLYHILETKTLNSEQYLSSFIGNFKSKSEIEELIKSSLNGELIQTFTNVFQPVQSQFKNTTPSKLYWNLYKLET